MGWVLQWFTTTYIYILRNALPSVPSIFSAELQVIWLGLFCIFGFRVAFFIVFLCPKNALQVIQVNNSYQPLVTFIQQWL